MLHISLLVMNRLITARLIFSFLCVFLVSKDLIINFSFTFSKEQAMKKGEGIFYLRGHVKLYEVFTSNVIITSFCSYARPAQPCPIR